MLDFWERGVVLAHGSTTELPDVARVIHTWIAGEVSTGELQSRFPFVSVEPRAAFFESGAAADVEEKWQSLYRHLKSEKAGALATLVEEAMKLPALRQLFPYTSLVWLCFSRCTGYPFSGDCPIVCSSRWIPTMEARPTKEQREALGPVKAYTVADAKGKFLGEGDATEAIDLIVRNLPLNCGPAVHGTRDGTS